MAADTGDADGVVTGPFTGRQVRRAGLNLHPYLACFSTNAVTSCPFFFPFGSMPATAAFS
jgi:hypothetical protein